MKRKIINIFLLITLLFVCTGCTDKKSNTKNLENSEITETLSDKEIILEETNEEEKNNEEIILETKEITKNNYDEILKTIHTYICDYNIDTLQENKGMIGISEILIYSTTDETLNYIGHTTYDINEDEIPELLITTTKEENGKIYSDNLLAIYTYIDNKLVCILEGCENNTYTLLKNNKIYNFNKGPADYFIGLFELNKSNELKCLECYFTEDMYEQENPIVFYSDMGICTADKTHTIMTMDDFFTAQTNYYQQSKLLEVIPFSKR